MRLLILSFYYPPDLSAGSFRTSALVEALRAEAREDLHIDLITSMPNRYSALAGAGTPALEEHPGLTIRRIPLPSHKSGMVDQSRAFAVFARRALALSRAGRWDLVYATSSRLMTAALGARVASRAGVPLYLDIRDLFTDTMTDLLATSRTRHLIPAFRRLERWTLRRAARVNLVSPGFLDHARAVAPDQEFRLFTNGIDTDFLTRSFAVPQASPDRLPVVFYGGNMGEGQGLHHVIPGAAKMLRGEARFRLVGDGGRRRQLEEAVAAAGLDNVEVLPPVPRDALYDHYDAADILFLHLNDHPAFLKVLPSKIFEYAATGKPVLAGVSGQAAEFVKGEVPGSVLFAPCDAEALAAGVRSLLQGPRHFERAAFRERHSRSRIMAEMARDVLSLIPSGSLPSSRPKD
ncbi:glycosyltransferase WbuB (plasmid) [Brevirhabdus pacifica]|uniref:Glycosyltransferase WbuB n=1 Tax=Brevirhabdus pacifica TaxID=1267768 RepID=A0A1P8QYK1_9RHOB|nr:glycosyltransferase family 4 protein [Brevirhabdus pacifica]APX91421.1 glycosyltransferase WbuB [Brevirhabdus pacifica]OWU74215.1 glycosyl transferase family 1 [Loktanella sp. 22II-4b]PJJ78975.1 glycosyltransferase involved in cell wall biosynthesis [Brevirhabdus pacifica]